MLVVVVGVITDEGHGAGVAASSGLYTSSCITRIYQIVHIARIEHFFQTQK